MNEPDEKLPKRTYKWPWFAAAAIVLGVVLAIVWMTCAVQRERQQRDLSAPILTH